MASRTTYVIPTPAASPITKEGLASLAMPLVRIAAGLMLIPHGAQKLFGWFGGYGLTATGQFFDASLGMKPGIVFAALAGFVEFFGGLALVLGLLTRTAAVGVAVLMGVALTVHLPKGFFWTSGGIEYPLMWGLVAIAVALHGAGRYSLDEKLGLRI